VSLWYTQLDAVACVGVDVSVPIPKEHIIAAASCPLLRSFRLSKCGCGALSQALLLFFLEVQPFILYVCPLVSPSVALRYVPSKWIYLPDLLALKNAGYGVPSF
jgi:hypothetical protein